MDENWETPKIARTKCMSRLPKVSSKVSVQLLKDNRQRNKEYENLDPVGISTHDETTETRENLRKQIQTELDILKLKDQVEHLGQLVISRNSHSSTRHSNESSCSISQLETENNELKSKLTNTEFQLGELQKGIVALQSEYHDETLMLKEQSQNLMSSINEQKLEKAKIKKENDKLLKKLTGLKSYLETLPSDQEFSEMKSLLKSKDLAISTLKLENDKNGQILEKLRTENSTLSKNIGNLTFKNQELELKVANSEDQIRNYEIRQEKALSLDPKDAQCILSQNAVLKENNERMKKYINVMRIRHKKEIDNMTSDLSKNNEKVITYEKELKAVNEFAITNRLTIDNLNQIIKKEKEKYEVMIQKQSILEKEYDEHKSLNIANSELDSHVKTLVYELGHCVHELESLSALTKQIVEGEDPNVSVLLGVREFSIPGYNDESISENDRMTILRNQLEEIKKIKEEIGDMRRVVSDKYAEKLGNNMTSCITQ